MLLSCPRYCQLSSAHSKRGMGAQCTECNTSPDIARLCLAKWGCLTLEEVKMRNPPADWEISWGCARWWGWGWCTQYELFRGDHLAQLFDIHWPRIQYLCRQYFIRWDAFNIKCQEALIQIFSVCCSKDLLVIQHEVSLKLQIDNLFPVYMKCFQSVGKWGHFAKPNNNPNKTLMIIFCVILIDSNHCWHYKTWHRNQRGEVKWWKYSMEVQMTN